MKEIHKEQGYGGLLRLAGEIGREPDLKGLLNKILQRSRPWMRAEACSIFLPDPLTAELVIHSAYGDSIPKLGEIRVPAGKGIVGEAMSTKKIINVDDVSKDSRFFSKADEQTGWKTKSLLAAPLVDGDFCIGVIEFLNPIGRKAFTKIDEEYLEYFSGLVSAALVRIKAHEASLERAQIQRDLELAKEMQQGLLPHKFPTRKESPNIEIFAKLEPAKEVSGDLYDFFPLNNNKICFVVGDVSGKGVAAGIFMAVTRTLIRANALLERNPVEILQKVNTALCSENKANLFVTIILGIVNTKNGEINYAQGGHNPPIVISKREKPKFEPIGGMPLGVFDDAKFGDQKVILQAGDALFVYTDGITEAMNAERKMFGESRLLNSVNGMSAFAAEQLVEKVTKDVRFFTKGIEPSDDITLLVIKHL